MYPMWHAGNTVLLCVILIHSKMLGEFTHVSACVLFVGKSGKCMWTFYLPVLLNIEHVISGWFLLLHRGVTEVSLC
jgi:hypothetical protein